MTSQELFEKACEVWGDNIPAGSATEFSLINAPHAHQYLMFAAGFEEACAHVLRYAAHRRSLLGAPASDHLLADVLAELSSIEAMAFGEQSTALRAFNSQTEGERA